MYCLWWPLTAYESLLTVSLGFCLSRLERHHPLSHVSWTIHYSDGEGWWWGDGCFEVTECFHQAETFHDAAAAAVVLPDSPRARTKTTWREKKEEDKKKNTTKKTSRHQQDKNFSFFFYSKWNQLLYHSVIKNFTFLIYVFFPLIMVKSLNILEVNAKQKCRLPVQ